MGKSKNDAAWEQIFEKNRIIEAVAKIGHAAISAAEINRFREARLMTKFDHRSQLPTLFFKNELSILPISRGGYVIGNFNTFHVLEPGKVETVPVDFPRFLESLDYRDINSEATAINCAFVCQILHDFSGEENLLPTVSGRMSSSAFGFEIDSAHGPFRVDVQNAQIEIDGGYEGDRSLLLIEAKNYLSEDFLVRQIFYPYKLWHSKVKKQVRPVFLTYSNGIFHLREFAFDDIGHYNSLRLVKEKKYTIQDGGINIEAIQKLLASSKISPEPEVPFPQADSFERVINLCELLHQRDHVPKEEITQNYDFDPRQTDYYSNAAKYLGLIDTQLEQGQSVCYLTEKGRRLFGFSIQARQLEFIKLILSHEVFARCLALYFEKGEPPAKSQVVEVMRKSRLHNVESLVTFERRASTVSSWLNWILSQVED